MKTLLHCCANLIGADNPHSQVTPREAALLAKHCKGAGTVVEIGCFEGRTTGLLAQNTSGIVYTVDPFFKGRLGLPYGKFIAKNHIRRLGLRNVRFVEDFSYAAAPSFPATIDFLFLDGDHTL